jgi:transcriptional/translational regulatory protein YebC/TACO1
MDSARFATVMFMFRHQGRVRVALSERDAAGGGVDRLFDNALAAGAEDFDQVPGADQGVEVEVCSVSFLWIRCHLMILVFHRLHVHRRRWEG